MTHLVPNTYSPQTFGPPQLVPNWLVPLNKRSPDIWSPTIGPSGQMVPNQFCPHGQMVPKNSVPMDKWSPTNLVPLKKWSLKYSVCPGGQVVMIWKYGDQIGWRPFVHGDQIFGDYFSMGTKFDEDHLSRGTKLVGTEFLGTICPWGQKVGDRKSGDQMGSGPNESQPILVDL